MLHVKSCNVKHNSERVFRYFASAVNSNYRVQNVIEKIFMLSVVIQALKKSVTFLCTTFADRCLICSDWAFEVTLHSSSARLEVIHPVQIHLIRIQDSPDHRSVRNKEVKFIWIYSLGPRFSVRCPYYRGFCFCAFHKHANSEVQKPTVDCVENFVGTVETVRNTEVSVPRGSTVLPMNSDFKGTTGCCCRSIYELTVFYTW